MKRVKYLRKSWLFASIRSPRSDSSDCSGRPCPQIIRFYLKVLSYEEAGCMCYTDKSNSKNGNFSFKENSIHNPKGYIIVTGVHAKIVPPWNTGVLHNINEV
jgi:hypothetical protein